MGDCTPAMMAARRSGLTARTMFMLALLSIAEATEGPAVDIFTAAELQQCGNIRIPQMTVTPTGVLLSAQCRHANQTSGTPTKLGDNMIHAKVVTKFSDDFGVRWGPMQVLTPIAHSHGQVVYDAVRKRVLLHYQYHPHAEPELNSTLFQRVSNDDGKTWSDERDITHLIARCNPDAPRNMQVGSAGSETRTHTRTHARALARTRTHARTHTHTPAS